jgi:hypothetical protein
MPKTPDPMTGRVVRISVNHGSQVYVTPQEFNRAEWVFGTGGYITIAAGLLMFLLRIL